MTTMTAPCSPIVRAYLFYVAYVLVACVSVTSVFLAGYAIHFEFWFASPCAILSVVSGIGFVVMSIAKWGSSE